MNLGILFKTYNGKHQLHIYGENWAVNNKAEIDEILALFDKKSTSKVVAESKKDSITLHLNGIIMDCKNLTDLKRKFGILAGFKEKYQEIQQL